MQTFLVALFVTLASYAGADTWVDEDGGGFIEIQKGTVTVSDTSSFYFFDQVFNSLRKDKLINFCLGVDQGSGMPSDCFKAVSAKPLFFNKGKRRSIEIDMTQNLYLLSAFEDALRNKQKMKISVDDGDLFSAFVLHESYKLNPEAISVLDEN
tara:strand:- start:50 stop:508 length:459 start_codon:yes stop_codon:yes gene_type:complete